ncbi:MAG: tetratricopeptide repeat protein [Bdellovibrionales bacterium]
MKRLILVMLALALVPSIPVSAQSNKRVSKRTTTGDRDLADALALAKAGRYPEASQKLFALSYSPRYRSKRMQIKYILGLTLHQMKLNQVAAFQFIGVVKEGNNKYIRQSLEKLSLAADALGDDTLLNYAISRVNVDQFPRAHRDMLHYRIGEYQMRNRLFAEAAMSFSRVGRGHGLFSPAKYNQGLAYAESKQLDRALATFRELVNSRQDEGPTDKARVAALMGEARVSYQKKDWDRAIELYREVPRDSEFWHDTLFESSWAMLRSGRFRSALSNFQSLHSAFYEDFYLPESLLLRAIVYLYICKYEEMEKVLNLFAHIYKPTYKQIDRTLDSVDRPDRYFNIMNDMMKMERKGEDFTKVSTPIPYIVAQKITREADFRNTFNYIRRLLEEKRRVKSLPGNWQSSSIGQYSNKVLNTRLVKAKQKAGKIVRNHLMLIKEELVDLMEQEGFARYEMINGKKESLKKAIAGKDLPDQQIDEDNQRDFYIRNGYEYWPFRGENWLDELGNYHYVGTQSCN